MEKQDLLIEIGCEELPPYAQKQLSTIFCELLIEEFKTAGLSHQNFQHYATPRRMAVTISNLIAEQATQNIEKSGPALEQAFDAEKNPTPACLGFARSCGVSVDQLEVRSTPKGERLFYTLTQPGVKTIDILPALIERSLKKLPITKPMRWGNHSYSFIRPVHWLIVLYGSDIVPCTILGINSSNRTEGHRFHAPQTLPITTPNSYSSTLHEQGFVIADFNIRKEFIRKKINEASQKISGRVITDETLLDEVTALVEWPVILTATFPTRFLTVPKEVLISSMQTHQKCFPIENKNGELLPYFIIVSNIESQSPKTVIQGNEKVMNARLSDAAFFYEQDRKKTLEDRLQKLNSVIFQKQLGSVGDKAMRIAAISKFIAQQISADPKITERAGLLAKCDLVSDMVYEFPNLQGIMGYYYALHDHESEEIATAIREHYYPRFAGDQLPQTQIACAVALADRLDSLIGILGINQHPTGDKDPYALRRMALGIVRILIEKELSLDLLQLLQHTQTTYTVSLPNTNVVHDAYTFIMGRLRAWYIEQGIMSEVFDAVLVKNPTILLDFHHRILAVTQFQKKPEANTLAAANKRVSNILKKQASVEIIPTDINPSLFEHAEEKELAKQLEILQQQVSTFYKKSDYSAALNTLALLKDPVDHFFDKVMVMVEDNEIRTNRLALLNHLHRLMTQVADISLLPS